MADGTEDENLEGSDEERALAERLAKSLDGGMLEGGALEGGALEGGALEGGALEGQREPEADSAELLAAAQLLRLGRRFELDPERGLALRGQLLAEFEARSAASARNSDVQRSGPRTSGGRENRGRSPAPRRMGVPGWVAWLPLPLALAGVLLALGLERATSPGAPAPGAVAAHGQREETVDGPGRGDAAPSVRTEPAAEPSSRVTPSQELLDAQARALASSAREPAGREARAALELELSRHRSRLLAALDAPW
jgi:hypothetical protein